MRQFVFLALFSLSVFFTSFAHAQLWQILPGENLATIVQKTGAAIVDSDTERLDPGLLVVTTHLQIGTNIYRCIEYVTEFQFELTRAACFKAVVAPPAKK